MNWYTANTHERALRRFLRDQNHVKAPTGAMLDIYRAALAGLNADEVRDALAGARRAHRGEHCAPWMLRRCAEEHTPTGRIRRARAKTWAARWNG